MDALLKILGDENRLKILRLLTVKRLCVCELEMLLELTQSNVSRHLGKLKRLDVILSEKEGQWIHYRINPDFIENHKELYDYLLVQFDKESTYLEQKERLTKYLESSLSYTDIRSDIDDVKDKLYKCGC
jgi:ArsR family transcriptional regulator